MEQIFIDRFIVPAGAKAEFSQRMAMSRNFIKQLPGIIRDEAYERNDEQGNLICITMAIWASESDLENAKQLVRAEYQKQGFDLPAMLGRLGINMERGQYQNVNGE
ncbi:MAG TPA: hypothetical protein VGN20_13985 [Mucilaginibacter sp.]|jgi:heme-degrading monooxygenase HmoA